MCVLQASQVAILVKSISANAGDVRDMGLICELGHSPGGRHGNPLQYSCLENPMDIGAWWVTVHGSQRVRHDLLTKQSIMIDISFHHPHLSIE